MAWVWLFFESFVATMYLPVLGQVYGSGTALIIEIIVNAVISIPVVTWMRTDLQKRGKKTFWWTFLCYPGFSNFLSLLLPIGIYMLRTKRIVRGVICLVLFIALWWFLNWFFSALVMAGAA